jgi:putative SOS response-associated peptidase YedK
MCGRYSLAAQVEALADMCNVDLPGNFPRRHNVAPGQPVLAIREVQKGPTIERQPALFQWGLVPSWASDPAIGNKLINARAETLTEKPSFRGALKYRRCLILADGFFEWEQHSKSKTPHYIHLRDEGPFAFAGLWETWEKPEGYLETCAIVTTAANDLLRPLHERMPVILRPSDYAEWLDPMERNPSSVLHLLQSYPEEEMALYPVSDLVNKVANEGPDLILPRPPDEDPSPDPQLNLF